MTVGLLHTVPALAATFDDLVRAAGRDLRCIHIVDAWRLDTARRDGVTVVRVDAAMAAEAVALATRPGAHRRIAVLATSAP